MDEAAEPAKKPDEKAALGQFFELKKQGYSRCLHGALDCKNEPVKAHSIQNGKVLDLLQKDNHVIVPQIELDPKTGPVFELKSLGRNKASTFSGLCSEHDNELFKLADTLPLDASNIEQLEQYAYRSVMKEFHTCVEQSDKFFALEEEYIRKGFIKPSTPNGARDAAAEFAARSQRVFRYRSQYFDLPKLEGKTPEIEHNIIELDNQTPTVAVSSLFGVGSEPNGDIIGVMLTVVPVSETKTTAIISYATAQAEAVKKALPDLFDGNADKKKALSETILGRVENFTLSPTFYDSWSEEKKKNVSKFFNDSLLGSATPTAGQDLLLF